MGSELIFAGILSENSHKLDFDKRCDFTLDDIPCQVKTIIPNESSFEKTNKKISDRIHELHDGKVVDETEVRREIISLLQEKHNLIDDAIRQGGRILCVNGTQTYAGYLLNRWSSDNPEMSLSDLFYKNNQFYIILVVDASDKSEYDPVGVLGVDLGIVNLAVDSDRQIFESSKVEKT